MLKINTSLPPFQTLDHHTDEALENETEATLNEKTWADLIALCQDRKLNAEGDKLTLIRRLLDWKINTRPVPAPSTPRLFSSDGSNNAWHDKINSVLLTSLLLDDDDLSRDIPYEELEIGKKLGSGGFKDCYMGRYKGEFVAIGELRIANFSDSDFKEIRHEISVLKQLRHDNIIRFIGVSTNTRHLCIITELCENGDMFDFMRAYPKPSFAQQIMYMHDIALGVAYLHTRRPSIIHRDLKSMNVLISADLRAKINDFGLARIRPRANASMHTQCGTPNWQAPEFWTPKPSYTEKVDVYACGLIFWEIMTWAEFGYPYQNFSEHQLYEAVRDKGVRPNLETLKIYPYKLLSLVEEMWRTNPRDRPSMGLVVEKLAEFLS
ncbi:kinase-like protein [Gigaspora margarita]|uniref:Kinase-like protein n=1 Tax=Gigaspora margarita TaxID=4874 RepID=A0A8H3X8B0_GIGMA|nr:kinase-like protein [Gigaspora margarita]